MLKKLFLAMMAVCAISIGFVSCSDDDDEEETTKYTVTYSTDYGTASAAIRVEDGNVLTEAQLSSITADGYVFLGWYDGDTKAVANTYKVTKNVTLTAKWGVEIPSSLIGKAFFDSTNGVGFAVLDDTQYAFIHSNAGYTGVTQKYYKTEKTSDAVYSLTTYKDENFEEEAGTVYTVKLTESGILLSFTNAQHASQAGTEYAMTHVFSSLFGKTYSGTAQSMTHTLSITDSENCTYKATSYMPNETAYTYTIAGVIADSTAKTLTYTMQWYKDGTAKGTHTVLITNSGITFDGLAMTVSE